MVGAPVGVAKAVYGTGAFIVDAGLAVGGNKGGADRMTERGKAVAEVLLQPRLVKDRIDASINVTVSKAAERRNAGNDFGAGLGLGFEGGEVAGPVVVGTLRFPKTEIPRIPGVERDSIPSKSPVKEAPRPPPTEAARSDAGITKEGPTKDISVEPAPSGTKTVVKPKTFITYEFKNAAGEVVYVGRASGKGTPEQVMKQRLAKGHDVYDANPGLIPEVRATQGSASANKGAEGVLYEQRMREGASLLNDPKSPPLSSKPAKAAEVREKISDYSEDLKH
ncbi:MULTISPECIES: hypothetical protein [unclassified Duganella]|uniref:hypothetical protein n=1 Tax=unclassified Duganella TaxID=2636909 RepID=UPI0012E3EDFD|nr:MULTISPECIES: hypothetical protein [unclassified Duganella]